MNCESHTDCRAFISLFIHIFFIKGVKIMTKQNLGSFRTKRIPFTQVPNTLIRDKNISLKAKGLYMLIQSYITIPDFVLYKSYLMKRCAEGEKAFDSAWKELKKAGYLKQYKYRNKEDTGFTYEYDLLDIPEIDDKIVDSQNGGVDLDPQNVPLQNVDLQKGGDINNTDSINTNSINTILSNHNNEDFDENIFITDNKITHDKIEEMEKPVRTIKISEEERQSNIDTLKENIEPEILKQKFPDKAEAIDEIFNLMCDTVNSGKEYIKISGEHRTIQQVKNCFFKLDDSHIEYILECLETNTTKVINPKAYLIATIYNSYYTYNNAVNLNFNHEFKDTMFVHTQKYSSESRFI